MRDDYYTELLRWRPFDIFDHNSSEGPLVYGLVALAVISAAAFVWLLFSSRAVQSYFSLRLVLALVPFGVGSAIMFIRIYVGLYVLAYFGGISEFRTDYPFPVLLRLGLHAFECGLLVSGGLLLTHTIVYAVLSNRRTKGQ